MSSVHDDPAMTSLPSAPDPRTPAELPRSSHFMAALADVERNFPVLEWSVDGIPIWPLVRLRWVFSEWARLYGDRQSRLASAGVLRRLGRIASGPIATRRLQRRDEQERARGDETAAHRKDVVLFSDGISFAALAGRWYERFCDPVGSAARELGLSSALWTPGHHPRTPRATPSVLIQPAIDRANIAGALAARLRPIRPALPGLDELRAALQARGFASGSMDRRRIASDTGRLRSLSRMFRQRLGEAQPRLAALVGYYGVEGMAFVLACRESGVRVVDLQHGVQGDMHPAYAAWPHRDPGHALLPDYFWVWSDWERRVIERWSRGTHHRAVAGGNPWMDAWGDGSRWPGVSEARAGARELKNRARGRPIVLVTLQYGMRSDEQLTPLAALLQAGVPKLVFWVRLHPLMLARREEIKATLLRGVATSADVVIDEASDLPLQALLQEASVHLTHSSTVVIEAAQFGLRSVVTSEYGAELFPPLYAAGSAITETGASDALVDALIRLSAPSERREFKASCVDTLKTLLQGTGEAAPMALQSA
ncbi:MAG: hypothetical protein ABIQ33_07110 [Caldimonas sp.]